MKGMMGISSPTGSHLPALEKAALQVPADGLVIEHGAGLYSTPLLARLDCRVICAEPDPGWTEWASWIYQGKAELVDSWKRLVRYLEDAELAFIDGPARERGPLLVACLEHGVPRVIVHDTQQDTWSDYGLHPHHFEWPGYSVTHTAEDSHRTTLWAKSPS